MALQLVFQLISLLLLFWQQLATASVAVAPSMAKPGCPETCGNVPIIYPFGIGLHCYKDEWYEVTCNPSSKPFLPKIGVEVLNITLEKLRVKSPVFQSCDNTTKVFNDRNSSIVLEGSPFFFSYYNTFVATGCDNFAYVTGPQGLQRGCVSLCSITINNTERACYGNNCCQSSIPYSLQTLDVTIKSVGLNNNKGLCNYAFLVDDNWFYDYVTNRTYMTNTTNHIDMTKTSYFPVFLDWTIRNGSNDYCDNNSPGRRYPGYYSCDCPYGYKGNPDLRGGCQVKECSPGEEYDCIKPKGLLTKAAILGVSLSLGLLFIIFTSWWLYQILKKRRNRKLKEKFFKRNGGMLLQQQISSDEGSVEKTKIFSAEDLEKATDHYDENRILGQGGQGTVYKGMLNDGRIVAVKKAKMVDESQVEQFINEVAILSQINHRNVVKLLGCCLETEVPLLVYEFISNGTLFHHIHDQSEEFFMSWDNRLRIATEVAGALAYLHSAASMPIYHRDIKSTNILLDDKHKAKVSDFGTSRSISVDKTHLTTIVQGTMGYLDPEYFQTSQFTDKSDVYSFGVVLVELLTGEKPISLINSQEWRNLVTHFIQSMKENRLLEILDNRVVDGRKEELEVVANIAKRCLNWNGKKRPTMKEVATELEGLKMSPVYLHTEKNHNVAEIISETSSLWDTGSTSTGYGNSENRVILPLDAQPLLFNTC